MHPATTCTQQHLVGEFLRAMGMGKQADALVAAMNRVPESVGEPKPVLVDAAKKMTAGGEADRHDRRG